MSDETPFFESNVPITNQMPDCPSPAAPGSCDDLGKVNHDRVSLPLQTKEALSDIAYRKLQGMDFIKSQSSGTYAGVFQDACNIWTRLHRSAREPHSHQPSLIKANFLSLAEFNVTALRILALEALFLKSELAL